MSVLVFSHIIYLEWGSNQNENLINLEKVKDMSMK